MEAGDLQKVVRLQRFVRRKLDRSKIADLNAEAHRLKADKVRKQDPSKAEMEKKAEMQKNRVIAQTNSDVWLEILSFAPDLQTAVSIMATCHLLQEITKFNLFWQPVFQYHFPVAMKSLPQDEPESINWRNKVKELTLVLQAWQRVVKTLSLQKELGNEHFRNRKWQEAADVYAAALNFSKESNNSVEKYKEVLTNDLLCDYHFLLAVLCANAAQAQLKLDDNPRALHHGVQAEKALKAIKKILGASRYKRNPKYKQLEEKITHRIDAALEGMGPLGRVVNYSSQPVEGLQQGSMLTHNANAFAGFFDDSKVLMTEMTGTTVVGLIVNKTYTPEGGREPVYIGGPCDIDRVTVLHNVAQAPGAVRVIDGVYRGGDLTEFKNDPGVVIREYHGHAAWFPGQLQGEILNSYGWDLTNEITPTDVFEPQELFEFGRRERIEFSHYF